MKLPQSRVVVASVSPPKSFRKQGPACSCLSLGVTVKLWLLSQTMHKECVRDHIFNYPLQYLFDIHSCYVSPAPMG